jgi:hypothetical protein
MLENRHAENQAWNIRHWSPEIPHPKSGIYYEPESLLMPVLLSYPDSCQQGKRVDSPPLKPLAGNGAAYFHQAERMRTYNDFFVCPRRASCDIVVESKLLYGQLLTMRTSRR